MEVFYMATTNLNIYTNQKEEIFNELEIPNDTTAAAIEEGRKIMNDPSTPRYSNIEALKKALDV
jgi:archaellum component FlaG (FlaF/FlaG flagellin family)